MRSKLKRLGRNKLVGYTKSRSSKHLDPYFIKTLVYGLYSVLLWLNGIKAMLLNQQMSWVFCRSFICYSSRSMSFRTLVWLVPRISWLFLRDWLQYLQWKSINQVDNWNVTQMMLLLKSKTLLFHGASEFKRINKLPKEESKEEKSLSKSLRILLLTISIFV